MRLPTTAHTEQIAQTKQSVDPGRASISELSLAVPSRDYKYSRWRRWMGIAVALICAVATMIIFRALRLEEHDHIERMTNLATDTVRADVLADLNARRRSELRFAKMWEGDEDDLTRRSWNMNSSLFMSHHPR